MMENIYVDGEVFLSDEVPNTLEESQFYAMHGEAFLSLHALSGHPKNKSIQLRALVKNQAMVILIDSRSSHTFLNSSLANKLHISASTILPISYMELLSLVFQRLGILNGGVKGTHSRLMLRLLI
jgi:hypothetical protein